MAWIDDRIWCHPKFAPLTPAAFTAYVKGLAYSSGMATGGKLEPAVQKLIGCSGKVRAELVGAHLWDMNGDGATVRIHDWDEHNGKRDQRRAKDRERKREMRASAGQGADNLRKNARTSAGNHAETLRKVRGPAHVDGSEGSDGSDKTKPTTSTRDPHGLVGIEIDKILKDIDP